MMTKEQKKAISKLNSALRHAHKCGIWLAGMDGDLFFATDEVLEGFTESTSNRGGDYCPVARANQFTIEDDGAGRLYSEGYQDSGGY